MDHSISAEDKALVNLATAKALVFIDKLLSKTFDKKLSEPFISDRTVVLKLFIDVADEQGVATARLAIPFAVVDGKAVFDHSLPELRGAVPERTYAINPSSAQAVNGGGIDIILESAAEYRHFTRHALTCNDFVWVTDDCVIHEDDLAAAA